MDRENRYCDEHTGILSYMFSFFEKNFKNIIKELNSDVDNNNKTKTHNNVNEKFFDKLKADAKLNKTIRNSMFYKQELAKFKNLIKSHNDNQFLKNDDLILLLKKLYQYRCYFSHGYYKKEHLKFNDNEKDILEKIITEFYINKDVLFNKDNNLTITGMCFVCCFFIKRATMNQIIQNLNEKVKAKHKDIILDICKTDKYSIRKNKKVRNLDKEYNKKTIDSEPENDDVISLCYNFFLTVKEMNNPSVVATNIYYNFLISDFNNIPNNNYRFITGLELNKKLNYIQDEKIYKFPKNNIYLINEIDLKNSKDFEEIKQCKKLFLNEKFLQKLCYLKINNEQQCTELLKNLSKLETSNKINRSKHNAFSYFSDEFLNDGRYEKYISNNLKYDKDKDKDKHNNYELNVKLNKAIYYFNKFFIYSEKNKIKGFPLEKFENFKCKMFSLNDSFDIRQCVMNSSPNNSTYYIIEDFEKYEFNSVSEFINHTAKKVALKFKDKTKNNKPKTDNSSEQSSSCVCIENQLLDVSKFIEIDCKINFLDEFKKCFKEDYLENKIHTAKNNNKYIKNKKLNSLLRQYIIYQIFKNATNLPECNCNNVDETTNEYSALKIWNNQVIDNILNFYTKELNSEYTNISIQISQSFTQEFIYLKNHQAIEYLNEYLNEEIDFKKAIKYLEKFDKFKFKILKDFMDLEFEFYNSKKSTIEDKDYNYIGFNELIKDTNFKEYCKKKLKCVSYENMNNLKEIRNYFFHSNKYLFSQKNNNDKIKDKFIEFVFSVNNNNENKSNLGYLINLIKYLNQK